MYIDFVIGIFVGYLIGMLVTYLLIHSFVKNNESEKEEKVISVLKDIKKQQEDLLEESEKNLKPYVIKDKEFIPYVKDEREVTK